MGQDAGDTARASLAKYDTFFNADLLKGNLLDAVTTIRMYLNEIQTRQGRMEISLPEVDAPYKVET